VGAKWRLFCSPYRAALPRCRSCLVKSVRVTATVPVVFSKERACHCHGAGRVKVYDSKIFAWGEHKRYPSQTTIWSGRTSLSECVFEALFNGESTLFWLQNARKCFEKRIRKGCRVCRACDFVLKGVHANHIENHPFFCSSFPNLRLRIIFETYHHRVLSCMHEASLSPVW
jgi:hypothetical protein